MKLTSPKNKTIILAIILSIILAYLPFYILGGFIGDLGDAIGQFIPNKILLLQYFKQGILPLINPYSFLGMPFMADMQIATFYIPDNLVFAIFPKFIAYNISLLTHVTFFSIGIYLWINKISFSKLTAYSLALTAGLTAITLNKLYFLNFFEVISYLPWILFLIHSKKPSVFFLTILFSLMIFAGHPIAVIYSFVLIIPYCLILERKKTKQIILALLFSSAITAIQTIPFLYLKSISIRDSLTYLQFSEGNLNFKDFLNLINPLYLLNSNKIEGFIYIGTFTCISFIISLFFIKKHLNKLYLTGLLLIAIGALVSLGTNIDILARLIFKFPILNLFRVPARYMIISHFGILICLASFFPWFIKKYKKIAIILLILISLNAFITPLFFLKRTEISDADKQYFSIQTPLNLKNIPEYYLISSLSLFPNRHFLNGFNLINGYNPLIPKIFNENFPMNSVGSFKNSNYLKEYFEKFNTIGLKYYFFPTPSRLKQFNLEKKNFVYDFLNKNNWKTIQTVNQTQTWKNPNPKAFISFEKSQNKIMDIKYTPSKIHLTTETQSDDILIVNQLYNSDWIIEETGQHPEKQNNIVQKYNISKDTKEITLSYFPKHMLYSIFISTIGIIFFIIFLYKNKSWKF